MREVSKDEFFAALHADTRDIMPSNVNPLYTVWEDRQRRVFGKTLPGWKETGKPKVYMLAELNV